MTRDTCVLQQLFTISIPYTILRFLLDDLYELNITLHWSTILVDYNFYFMM